MKLPWIYNIIGLPAILITGQVCGQNTISVKKTSATIEAIFKSSSSQARENQYYCFKKNGYVYYFNSKLKDKKIIKNCQEQQWLKTYASPGKYYFFHDTISISPLTYSMYGKETTNEFSYIGILDSVNLDISAIGKNEKTRFNLLFPNPIINQE